ncbi:hypothetical protein BSKO_02502 [Bryopsis sp. KO-2023]|nr:hypothetical protein BSKO_02502 [Bryopsis sp. KO-2023]
MESDHEPGALRVVKAVTLQGRGWRRGSSSTHANRENEEPLEEGVWEVFEEEILDENEGTNDTNGQSSFDDLLGKIQWRKESYPSPFDLRTILDNRTPTLQLSEYQTASPLGFFLHFAPTKYFDGLARRMTEVGQARGFKWRRGDWIVSRGIFYRWVGVWKVMALYPMHSKHKYWQNTSEKGPVVCNLQEWMSRNEFYKLNSCLSLLSGGKKDDPLDDVRPFWDALNEALQHGITPGTYITADESMVRWTGRSMPGMMYIPRKPRPLGLELKVLCCSISKCVLRLEVQEGKEEMGKKEFANRYKATVAGTLRLTKHYHGSHRVLIADSWFGSVRSCAALLDHGLYSILNVKMGHSFFPKTDLLEDMNGRKGASVSFRAKWKGLPLLAVGWHHLQPMLMVASASTARIVEGRVSHKIERYRSGEERRLEVIQSLPEVHLTYKGKMQAVDVLNHHRQGGLFEGLIPLEDIWRTDDWRIRHFSGGLDFIFTQVTLAWKQWRDSEVKPNALHHELAMELLENPWRSALFCTAEEKKKVTFTDSFPRVAMNQVPIIEWDLPLNIIKGILEKTSKRDLARSRSVASTWCQASGDPRLSEKLRCEKLWRSKDVVPVPTPPFLDAKFTCATKKDDLIALGGDSLLVLSNTQIGRESRILLNHHDCDIFAVGFVDKMLLSGDGDGRLCAWDVDTSHSLFRMDAHSTSVFAIEELREEVATAGGDHLIKLWGKEDWECKNVLNGHQDEVSTLSSTDDKKRLISGSWDKTIRIWNVVERTCIHVLHGNYRGDFEVSRVFGGLIASGADDRVIRVWDLNNGSVVKKFQGDSDFLPCIAVGCGRLISGFIYGVVSVWDIEQGDCIRKLAVPSRASTSIGSRHTLIGLWCDDKMIIGVTDNGACLTWDFT